MPFVGVAVLSSTSIATPPRPRRQGLAVDVLSSADITTSPLSRWSCLVPPLQGALTIREEIELMRTVYKLLGGLHAFNEFNAGNLDELIILKSIAGNHLFIAIVEII
uniref:Uncharacterized protein n=1 Tax=Oryza glumipatula TaxID=40148 RepID=A0A0D9YPX2_9ORYZ